MPLNQWRCQLSFVLTLHIQVTWSWNSECRFPTTHSCQPTKDMLEMTDFMVSSGHSWFERYRLTNRSSKSFFQILRYILVVGVPLFHWDHHFQFQPHLRLCLWFVFLMLFHLVFLNLLLYADSIVCGSDIICNRPFPHMHHASTSNACSTNGKKRIKLRTRETFGRQPTTRILFWLLFDSIFLVLLSKQKCVQCESTLPDLAFHAWLSFCPRLLGPWSRKSRTEPIECWWGRRSPFLIGPAGR